MTAATSSPDVASDAQGAPRGAGGRAPRATVVIPTLRGGRYLEEAVKSVIAQSMTDWELLVVSDGCPDDLTHFEREDPRIHLIRQERRGASVARNVGMRASRSDLVAFLDDDDRMLPDRLAEQTEAMERHPRAGLCHTQFRVIDGEGALWSADDPEAPEGGRSRDVDYRDLLLGRVRILFPTTMVRRSVLEELGTFDSMLVTGEDLEVIFAVARHSELCFLPEVLTEYRRHGGNTSGEALEMGGTLEVLLRKHLRFAEMTGDTSSADAAREGIRWARRYAATGSVLEARSQWRRGAPGRTALALARAAWKSPGETLGDVVGNRRLVPRLRPRAGADSSPNTR